MRPLRDSHVHSRILPEPAEYVPVASPGYAPAAARGDIDLAGLAVTAENTVLVEHGLVEAEPQESHAVRSLELLLQRPDSD